jgi:hypothetical protein
MKQQTLFGAKPTSDNTELAKPQSKPKQMGMASFFKKKSVSGQ